jgi:rsbT antagonist protein RsbS
MRVPILKQGPYLIASIQDALADAELLEFRGDLVNMAGDYRSRGCVIDVTALDIMDSFAARMIRTIVEVLRLRGVITVIVGIQPDVAFSMVQLGLSLPGVLTALDLEEGLMLLDQRRRISGGRVR